MGDVPPLPLPLPLPVEGLRPLEHDELLAIVGETASGKTHLALHLARRLGGEVIGADSVQVYRGFDIGSGKPTREELGSVAHHLIDVVDPGETFDAGRFVDLADRAIAEVRARGKIPILCGGTYLWVKALVFGLAEAPRAPAEVRAALQAEAEARGAAKLHARLSEIDPATAARLHPNDAVRIVRALEVHAVTGRPISALQEEHGFARARHRLRAFAIGHDRAELEARIAQRTRSMLARGLVDEVRGLVARGHGTTRPMGSLGYAQVKAFLEGRLAESALEAEIVRATRIFARRQRTWLKQAEVTWIAAERLTG